MTSRSAKFFNRDIKTHSVCVPNKPPNYVTEYKENFKWPPRSAYLIPHNQKPPPSPTPPPPDLAKIAAEPKGLPKIGVDGKQSAKPKLGPPSFAAPDWKKLKKITSKILASGYEKPLITKAKKAIKSKTVNKELRDTACHLFGALLAADFENARNGKPAHPPIVLKYFRAFVKVVKRLEGE